tara:strand:- start:421 stop:756 length:336 start_codon:yes stop_codon:yes gene_type:complete
MTNKQQNPFEKLWFSDVLNKFQEKKFNISYNLNTFKAFDKFDETHRFVVQLAQNKINVTIPLEKNYEYNTSFKEYYKVSNYLLYHLNDTTPLINTYEFIDKRKVNDGIAYH